MKSYSLEYDTRNGSYHIYIHDGKQDRYCGYGKPHDIFKDACVGYYYKKNSKRVFFTEEQTNELNTFRLKMEV